MSKEDCCSIGNICQLMRHATFIVLVYSLWFYAAAVAIASPTDSYYGTIAANILSDIMFIPSIVFVYIFYLDIGTIFLALLPKNVRHMITYDLFILMLLGFFLTFLIYKYLLPIYHDFILNLYFPPNTTNKLKMTVTRRDLI
jgi:hypothetical protein